MSKILCPHCGTANVEQARFCAKCGKSLPVKASPSPTTCPRCHVPLRTSARFCPSCGYNLVQSPTPAGSPKQARGGSPPDGQAPIPGTQLLGSSDDVTELVVRWMGGNTQQHSLNKPVETVGRASSNDIVINHPAVSSRHLSLQLSLIHI